MAKLTREGTDGNWGKYYYHTDLVGTTRTRTDGNGVVVARFDYEAFGEVSQQAGSAAADELHRFTGKSIDGTGLYYFNARYMDPEIGRFVSRDPAMDGLNWYVYGNCSPLRYVDQDGQIPLDTIVDVVWLLWDVGRVARGNKSALTDIAIDVAGLAIPVCFIGNIKGY